MQKEQPDQRKPPSTPKHPDNDVVMPPYTPGGVPPPEDPNSARRNPPNTYPPRNS